MKKIDKLKGSDGANSFIRTKTNFPVMKWDYEQIAIVSTLKLSQVWAKSCFSSIRIDFW